MGILLVQDKCLLCSKPANCPGALCERHYDKHLNILKRAYWRKRALGLCVYGGCKKSTDNCAYCPEHLAKICGYRKKT